MEHLDFVLWVTLFPITFTLNDFIQIKMKVDANDEPFSEQVSLVAKIVKLLLWVLIGIALWV